MFETVECYVSTSRLTMFFIGSVKEENCYENFRKTSEFSWEGIGINTKFQVFFQKWKLYHRLSLSQIININTHNT